MIYLLDTHAFVWASLETQKLGRNARNIIVDNNNEICVSTISFWEISLKTGIKNFFFENTDIRNFPKYAEDMGFTIINLKKEESISFHELPQKTGHKDPFDRMLIWQAIKGGMTLISGDKAFKQYRDHGLKLIW